MKYSVKMTQENDAFLVSSRDLAELNSVGYSLEQALKEALDGIETTFMMYMDDRKRLPLPSASQEGEYQVRLPVLVAAKVNLYNEMFDQKVTKAELARRLGWIQKQADRLLSLNHASKIEALESAFHALGRELNVSVS